MNRGLLLAGIAGALLVLICLTWPAHRPTRPGHAPGRHTNPAPTSQSVGSRRAVIEATRLLPFTPNQITQATRLACAFTAAYRTHHYDEPPDEYIQRLAPMISPSLRAVIERTSSDPAELSQQRRLQQITSAHAAPEAIRTLGPTSITFLITTTERTTTTYASREEHTRYAITITTTDTGGWTVHDVELATTGQTGDASGDPR